MFRPFKVDKFSKGAILLGEPDSIDDGALRRATNIRTDRTLLALEVRPGWTARTSGSLGPAIVYLSRLFTHTTTYGYAQIGTALRRLTASWATPTTIALPGTQVISDANSPDGAGTLHKYFVNNTVAVKDDGTTTSTMGIAAPTAAPMSSALSTDLTTQIDDMKTAANWTGANLAAGPSNDATNYVNAPSSVAFTVAASTFGSIAQFQSAETDIDTLTGGDDTVKNDDYIHLWIRLDVPARVVFVQIDVDIDATASSVATCFRHDYYSIRLGSLEFLSQGAGQYTKLQIRKAEFERFGGDASRSWANARGFRIGVQTNSLGAVLVNVDDLKLRGGVGMEGEIEYTVTYKNSSTHARGNPPKDADGIVLYTAKLLTDRQPITLDLTNITQGGANHPGDDQIDMIQVWRRGGNFTTAVLVAEVSDTGSGSFIDGNSDATLVLTNVLLETDNDVLPAGTTRVLFGPDGTGSFYMLVDGYRLYKSKPYEDKENRVENWPALAFAFVGDGSARALAGIATSTQVAVWTSAMRYRVVGIGQDTFLPVPVDGTRGIVGQFAVCAGEGVLYFVSQDGIYADIDGQQSKLTAAIDPFFQGLTVDGQAGLGVPPDTTRLAYLHQPKGALLVMNYGAGFLVVKPNLQNLQLTECFFGESALTQITALYLDVINRELLAGAANGQVYKIEDETVYTDAGTALSFTVRTKSYDLGQPQHGKFISTYEVEGQTNNQALTLTAHYDRGTVSEAVGTVQTTSEVALTLLESPTKETRRRDVALQLTGTVSQRIVVTRLGCFFEPQPEMQTFLDSGIISFDFVQLLKRFEIDANAPSTSQLTIYADGAQVLQRDFLATTGRKNAPYYLPAGLRGREWRVTLEAGSAPFLVYKWSGYFKQLGIDQQYIERVMVQGV